MSMFAHLGFCSVVDVSKGYLRHHINGLPQWALVTAAANPHKRQDQFQTPCMIFHTFIILSDSFLRPKWRNSFDNCIVCQLFHIRYSLSSYHGLFIIFNKPVTQPLSECIGLETKSFRIS